MSECAHVRPPPFNSMQPYQTKSTASVENSTWNETKQNAKSFILLTWAFRWISPCCMAEMLMLMLATKCCCYAQILFIFLSEYSKLLSIVRFIDTKIKRNEAIAFACLPACLFVCLFVDACDEQQQQKMWWSKYTQTPSWRLLAALNLVHQFFVLLSLHIFTVDLSFLF